MTQPSVLVITRHYFPEPTGSAPPMTQLAEWMAREGFPTRVVTVRPSYPTPHVFDGYAQGQRDRETLNQVDVIRWPTNPVRGTGLLWRVGPECRFMLQLWKAYLSNSFRPARMLVSLSPSIFTVIGALGFRASGGRHIAVVHDIQSGLGQALGSPAVKMLMLALKRLERWTLNRVDEVVVLSDSMADAIRSLGVTRPITVLPPQIDCSAIQPRPRATGAPPTLMYSGNFGRKQGLQQVLDAAELLKVREPDIRIIMRGEGALKSAIEQEILTRGLTNIQFLPLVAEEELCASLAEGDVHLVPQIADGGDFAVPSKAFAIMAAGRPFIATGTPGSAIDRLARASGAFVCVPPFDSEAFARTAAALLRDDLRRARLGEAGRRFVLGYANTEVVMRRMVDLLEGDNSGGDHCHTEFEHKALRAAH